MTDSSDLRDVPEANEAVQAVVDRVLSYHAGAPAGTARAELVRGLGEIGEEMPEDWLTRTADQISVADPAQND